MTQSNKKGLSKSEIINSLNFDGLYIDFPIEETRYAAIIDGNKFYDKVTSLYPNTFTNCIDDNDVLRNANAFYFQDGSKFKPEDLGIELEKKYKEQ